MKRGSLVLSLILISILGISGCENNITGDASSECEEVGSGEG